MFSSTSGFALWHLNHSSTNEPIFSLDFSVSPSPDWTFGFGTALELGLRGTEICTGDWQKAVYVHMWEKLRLMIKIYQNRNEAFQVSAPLLPRCKLSTDLPWWSWVVQPIQMWMFMMIIYMVWNNKPLQAYLLPFLSWFLSSLY